MPNGTAPPTSLRGWLCEAALFAAVALSAAAILFPGLVLGTSVPASTEYVGVSDFLDEALPFQRWAAASWKSGALPLWFPGGYGGMAASAIPEAVIWYPPAMLPHILWGAERAAAWVLAMHLVLAGTGAALLARVLGAPRAGAALAAIAASCGLWLPNHFRQVNLLMSAAWVPWAWFALEMWLQARTPRRAGFLAFTGGAMALAGHSQVVHHAAVVLSIYAGVRIARDCAAWRRDCTRSTVLLVLAATLAGLMALPHLWPTLEMARLSRSGLADSPDRFPGQPRFLATLLSPFLIGSPADDSVRGEGIYWEESLYVGILPLALAAFGLWHRRRTHAALLAVLAASLWLAYGRATGVFWIPGGGLLRFLQRHLWFVQLVLCVGAALGFGALPEQFRSRRVAVLIALIALLDLRLNVPPVCPVGPGGALLDEPASAALLRAAGANPGSPFERVAFVRGEKNPGFAAWQAAGPWSRDPAPYVEYRNLLLPQHASLWGWSSVQGHVGLAAPWNRAAVYDQHDGGLYSNLQVLAFKSGNPAFAGRLAEWAGALGARWILSSEALSHPSLSPIGTLPGKTVSTFLYRNGNWHGGAWICRKTTHLASDAEAGEYMLWKSPGYFSEIVSTVMLAPLAGESDASDTLALLPSPTGRVRLEVSQNVPGYLVLALNYDPRWMATLDGEPMPPPARVNLSMMAVKVPAGAHRVEFTFDPAPDMRRAIAALAAFVVSIALMLRRATPA